MSKTNNVLNVRRTITAKLKPIFKLKNVNLERLESNFQSKRMKRNLLMVRSLFLKIN